MTHDQMLYLILIVVAFLIFAGALMRAMLLTAKLTPPVSREAAVEHAYDRPLEKNGQPEDQPQV